ncbi:MAG TPA: penicillin-binding protein 2 [Microbacteriaceae bacterium]
MTTTVKSTRRRAAVAIVTILALVAVLVVKLVDIQVVHAESLDAQAAASRGNTVPIYAARGAIVAADGTPLADSVLRYDFAAAPNNASTFPRTDSSGKTTKVTRAQAAAEIGKVTGQTAAQILAIIAAALKANPNSQYALIAKNLDVPAYEKLQALNIPWLYAQSHPARTYPNGAVAGNLVGFVGSEGQPQAGLELSENSCLAGHNGEETYQHSEDGVTLPGSTVVSKKAKPGGTLITTLDPDLTWFAGQQLAQTVPALGAQFGMATVTDIKGNIKAAAQYPAVDPNNVGATAPNYWGSLMFSTPFEPGSTFKSLTAAALIDTGKATPTSQVLAPYEFKSGNGADLHDAGYHAPERLTLTGVLMESSNTGISILGSKLDDQTRYDYLKKFGIGTSTAVNIPGQSSGELHPVSQWDDQTKYATMFGQGVSATQAQMVSAYQALANGGVRMPLTLVEGCKQADGTITDKPSTKGTRVVSAATANTVLDMLESVTTTGEVSKQLQIPGYLVAAKTGTAQIPDGHGGYQQYYYVSVMGVAPVDDPQYVVSVNIGYPTTITSSAAAAPLFKTIMSQVLKTYRVKPSVSAPSNLPPFY